jgi:MYXO-CTERM domain-containing protein
MKTRALVQWLGVCALAGSSLAPKAARAALPAAYLGKPFEPATAGGVGIIPASVKAGPYALPGRLDLANYDLGGEGVAFHTEAHYTTKDGDGYRTDRPTATMCLTLQSKPDVWYDTSAALDGSFYPANDFYIGSVHPNDWFNYTVDVKTAGTYALSANFSTGNGPPGGEGGDGTMELVISVNGTMMADWKATFPDFENKANFHNWRAYPNFAMLTLEAGPQLIKLQLPYKHLNLDYLQFDLMSQGGSAGNAGNSGVGGTDPGFAGGPSSAGSSNGGAAGMASSSAGVAGTTSSTAGTPGAGGNGTAGAASAGNANGEQPAPGNSDSSGCACHVTPTPRSGVFGMFALLALGLSAAKWRRRAGVHSRHNWPSAP